MSVESLDLGDHNLPCNQCVVGASRKAVFHLGPIVLERKLKLSLIFVATQYEHITTSILSDFTFAPI